MNLLAYAIAGTGTLVGVLIHLLIFIIIFAVIWWVLSLIPLEPFLAQLVRVIFAVICAVILIVFLLGLVGCTTDATTGQQRPLTPEEAQGYSNAAHTIVHGAVSDYKEVKEATR